MRFPVPGVLLLVAVTAVQAQSLAPTIPSDLQEETRVRRIQWPITLDPRVPGGCDDVSAENILVREDGVEVRVDGVETRPLPAIHAIVIDNSISMGPRLGAAKKAALAYLERLPPEEPAMLASFSNNLVMHARLTTDRATMVQAMDRIQPQSYTALNDAIYYTVTYLAERPERKILVLITDGCDTASLTRHTLHSVVKMAGEAANLTVFPIGIDLPTRCEGPLMTPGYLGGPILPLQTLATHSGGHLYRTKETAALGMVFDEIFERIRSEGYVTYRPLPHGERDKDRRGETRKRRVRIESLRPERCKVASAGPPTRAEPARTIMIESELVAEDETFILYRDWWSEDQDTMPVRRLELREHSMHGHGADLDLERGFLYSATAFHLNGRYISEGDRKVRIISRDFTVDVPPFEWVRQSMTGSESLLLYLLQRNDAPFLPLPDPRRKRDRARRALGENWVHGQTMLEIRDALGRGLFRYPGYRELAYRRTQQAYREEMRRVLEHSSQVRGMSDEDRARLEQTIAEQRPEPRSGQLQQYLADWLGDISAYELVVGFEGWVVNAMLDSDVPESTAEFLLDLIDTKWDLLDEWFPPPTQVRIVTPLVPSYDVDRDLVGFWRILLPEVAVAGAPRDGVPERPLGLTFLRHLIELTGGRDAWPEGVRMQNLSYRWKDRKSRHRAVRGARKRKLVPHDIHWSKIPMVHMTLGPNGYDPLPCTVLWDPKPKRPDSPPPVICVDLGNPATRPSGAWVDELRDSILDIAPECVIERKG
ncbi:MAG: VWA domain-containing protein [Acidobacteriota bacterium]